MSTSVNWAVLVDGEVVDVTAEYWLIDEDSGWIYFKTTDHKVVHGFRGDTVTEVRRAEATK